MDIQRSGLTKQLQLLPLAVRSLVRDILELNDCTKLFHQTIHALSAQLCRTRRNIGVLRGKHHSNQTTFSIAFFAAFSAFVRIFPHFLPIPATAFPPPPRSLEQRGTNLSASSENGLIHVHGCASW